MKTIKPHYFFNFSNNYGGMANCDILYFNNKFNLLKMFGTKPVYYEIHI